MTAYFEFWPTENMSAYQFENRIKATPQLRGLTLKIWSRQTNKNVYQVIADRPEALILLGQTLQIILDEIIPDETGINRPTLQKAPIGGRALV
ncbi:MAG: hypothetical protein EPGJADBJ_04448 [Saprospiraceae bacterium]|nr:hypothetical protein [Saprospiraceae bacterium]